MSPGTSHSVCLSVCCLKDLSLFLSLSVPDWPLTHSVHLSLFSNLFPLLYSFIIMTSNTKAKSSGHLPSSPSSSNYLSPFSIVHYLGSIGPWPWDSDPRFVLTLTPLLPSPLIPLEASSKDQSHNPLPPHSFTALQDRGWFKSTLKAKPDWVKRNPFCKMDYGCNCSRNVLF